MAEKIIHVDAYTRSDGTYVREHERHIYTDNYDYSLEENGVPLLQGGIEVNNYLESLENIFNKSKAREDELLDELSQIDKGNQTDLLNEYVGLKNKNNKMQKALITLGNLTEYAAEILKEQGKLFNDTIQRGKKKAEDSIITAFDNNPKITQNLMDLGINVIGTWGMNDAKQLWNLASHGFDEDNGIPNPYKLQAQGYVNKNGKKYDKIDDLPLSNGIKQSVRKKVRQQLGTDDIEGFIFHENSSLADNISKSPQLKKLIQDNYSELRKNKIINSSLSFSNSFEFNLWASIGKSDILDLHITPDGYIECYVLDTYDFNQNGILPIKPARSVQEHGKFHNYYALTKIRI